MEKTQNNFEKRTLKRRHLVFYLEIYNSENNELIGHLGDITTQGLLILSPTKELSNNTLNIKIKLPNNRKYSQEFLELKIESKWSQMDVNPAHYTIGCLLISPSDKDVVLIKEIIKDLAFSD